jgi:hypothetical protein
MNEFLKHRQKYLLMELFITDRPSICARPAESMVQYTTVTQWRFKATGEESGMKESVLNFKGYWTAWKTCKELNIWDIQKVEAFNDIMP